MTPSLKSNRKHRRGFDRLFFVRLVFFILGIFLLFRLFQLQIWQYKNYFALAMDQRGVYQELLPKRGEIFVRERYGGDKLYSIALNQKLNLVYAIPREIHKRQVDENRKQSNERVEQTVKKVAKILELTEDEILQKISKRNDPYEPLKHYVSDESVRALDGLIGISFIEETSRYYPEKNMFSHVLGFMGYKNDQRIGQYGIEEFWQNELAGVQSEISSGRDVSVDLISDDKNGKNAEHGANIVLTLDHSIQFHACSKLAAAVKKHQADSGSVVIIEPNSGAILAMCNYPDFDPNKYNQVEDLSVFSNLAISEAYESGSVFKAITMAIALDEGVVTPETLYEDTGEVKIGKYTINNSDLKAHGWQTMAQVLEKSLNTGMIFVQGEIGKKKFVAGVENFGFGTLTGISLPSEASGDISSLHKRGDIYSATASFGQGLTVTPLQLVTAFSAIANGGKLMEPYIIERFEKSNGDAVQTKPMEIRQVISPLTAMKLSGMLVSVIESGHGSRAGVPGYYVAGKTGTAQVPKEDGSGYKEDHTIGSFIGFAPVDNPRFVMLVKIDHPRDAQWAESSAAPLFGEIAKFLLGYFQVPPER